MAASDCVDLLIVGGGINGAGIARDAAGRGLKVALVEQSDLAAATSSASTKLIHGGLRYLEFFEFRLVRESLIERERLLRIAPHLVRPMQFILPHVPGLRPRWQIRFGLFFYDYFSGRRTLAPSRSVRVGTGSYGALRPGVDHAFAYSDCWVDDSRLVVLNALDAAQRGAAIHTRTRFVSAAVDNGVWRARCVRQGSGESLEIRARAIVNAAGPWVEQVLKSFPGVQRRGQRAAREGQPHRRAATVPGQARVHAAEPRRPDRVRDSLRAEVDAGRHDRRAVLRRPRARAHRRRRDPLPVRHDQQLLPASDRAERRALDVRRRAAALRRRIEERFARHARLSNRAHAVAGASAAAVDLRRQAHDLSAARRNRAGKIAGLARHQPALLDAPRAAPGRRFAAREISAASSSMCAGAGASCRSRSRDASHARTARASSRSSAAPSRSPISASTTAPASPPRKSTISRATNGR